METLVRRQAGLEGRCLRASVLAGSSGSAPAPTGAPWCSHPLFIGSTGIVQSSGAQVDLLSSPRHPSVGRAIGDETKLRMKTVACCPSGHRSVKGSTTKRGETPEEKRSQVDPPHGRTDARVHRRGRWRQSPLRLQGYMDGPASLASIPPPAAFRRGPLTGFVALAAVRRHRISGGHRRVSDTSATGLSDALKTGDPGYPLSYNGGWRGGGFCSPFDPPQVHAPEEVADAATAPLPRVGVARCLSAAPPSSPPAYRRPRPSR